MRAFLLLLLLGCSVSAGALAEPFYSAKPLAHPVIKNSQESGATLAFIREAEGVVGYSCLCDSPDGVPHVLDRYGDCLLYTSPSPRDQRGSRMPSSA